MAEDFFEVSFGGVDAGEAEEEDSPGGGWAWDGDFGVAADDDGVGMVTGVGPTPDGGFAHDHEGGDFIEGVVEKVGFEGGAVGGFVPAGVGGGGVDGAVDGEGEDGVGGGEEVVAEEAEDCEE